MTWKNIMQVFHTAGVPPNNGRTILAMIGCTRNRRKALKKMHSVKSINMRLVSNTQLTKGTGRNTGASQRPREDIGQFEQARQQHRRRVGVCAGKRMQERLAISCRISP